MDSSFLDSTTVKKEDMEDDNDEQLKGSMRKMPKLHESSGVNTVVPLRSFVNMEAKPLSQNFPTPSPPRRVSYHESHDLVTFSNTQIVPSCKQFWKAGDFETDNLNNGNIVDTTSMSGLYFSSSIRIYCRIHVWFQ